LRKDGATVICSCFGNTIPHHTISYHTKTACRDVAWSRFSSGMKEFREELSFDGAFWLATIQPIIE